MSRVYKPTQVTVTGSHRCGCGLADHDPPKTRTRGMGLTGFQCHLFATEYLIISTFFSYFFLFFLFFLKYISVSLTYPQSWTTTCSNNEGRGLRCISSSIYVFYTPMTDLGHEGRGIGMRKATWRAGAWDVSRAPGMFFFPYFFWLY